MKKSLVTLLALSLFLSGCATILNEDNQSINVATSNNKEAKGTVDGVPFTAPGILSVKRAKADKIIVMESPSCAKQTLLASQVDTKFFINVLSGGPFGSTTDYSTDKMWKYQENVTIPCN